MASNPNVKCLSE